MMERDEAMARWNAVKRLGVCSMTNSMTQNTAKRNTRLILENRQAEHAIVKAVQNLGLGGLTQAMTRHTKERNARGRNHEIFTPQQNLEVVVTRLILQKCRCAITDLPMAVYGTKMHTPWDDFRASPDRIDNSVGYTLENTQMVCTWVNVSTAYAFDSALIHSILKEGAKTIQLPEEEPPYQFHRLYLERDLWVPLKDFDFKSFGLRQKPRESVYNPMRDIALRAFDMLEQTTN